MTRKFTTLLVFLALTVGGLAQTTRPLHSVEYVPVVAVTNTFLVTDPNVPGGIGRIRWLVMSNSIGLWIDTAMLTEGNRATAYVNTVFLTLSNYTDTKAALILQSSTNFSRQVFLSNSNYTDTRAAAVLQSSTNYADAKAAVAVQTSTNYADAKAVTTVQVATNYANALFLINSNYAHSVKLVNSNYTWQVSNTLYLSLTNAGMNSNDVWALIQQSSTNGSLASLTLAGTPGVSSAWALADATGTNWITNTMPPLLLAGSQNVIEPTNAAGIGQVKVNRSWGLNWETPTSTLHTTDSSTNIAPNFNGNYQTYTLTASSIQFTNGTGTNGSITYRVLGGTTLAFVQDALNIVWTESAPTGTASGKVGWITLESFGGLGSNICGAFKVQP